MGDILAGAVGGFVAILAYAASSGRPNLELDFNFKGNHGPGVLRFKLDAGARLKPGAVNPEQLVALIKLTKKSAWSARNPALRIELIGSPARTRCLAEWS